MRTCARAYMRGFLRVLMVALLARKRGPGKTTGTVMLTCARAHMWGPSRVLTVALLARKGGTGKTTLSLNLAVAALAAGQSVVLLDVDPQRSASMWAEVRQRRWGADDTPVDPPVVPARADQLAEFVERARAHAADVCLVDTPPHVEATAVAAARVADLVLVPCRPSLLDLKAIAASYALAQAERTPAWVVLSCVAHRGRVADRAQAVLEGQGLSVAPARVAQRVDYVDSLNLGLSVLERSGSSFVMSLRPPKAVTEIVRLYGWVERREWSRVQSRLFDDEESN